MTDSGVWSLIWQRDGRVMDASLEVLGEAQRVAGVLGTEAVGIVLGDINEDAVAALGTHGADRVLIASAPQLAHQATKPATSALTTLVEQHVPRLVLMPATANGRDIGPRLAIRTGLGLVTDCTFLRVDPAGEILATRPACGGRIAQRVKVGTSGLVMIAPGVFPLRPSTSTEPPTVESVTLKGLPEPDTMLLGSKPLEPDDLSLEEADVIVAGGLGIGGEAGFRSLEKLAAVLGAKIAASRRATDLGWIEREALVGQTGATVRPTLYLACGISGASQHVLGMRESQMIVAVNADPNAPIFGIADVGVVGDAATVIPHLTDAFRRGLSEGSGA